MRKTVPGRIESIVNIHDPSIEFPTADPRSNNGAVVILVAGGGHTTVSLPNIELHIYGNGRHAGGLADRNYIPFRTWQYRFIDWFPRPRILAETSRGNEGGAGPESLLCPTAAPGRAN